MFRAESLICGEAACRAWLPGTSGVCEDAPGPWLLPKLQSEASCVLVKAPAGKWQGHALSSSAAPHVTAIIGGQHEQREIDATFDNRPLRGQQEEQPAFPPCTYAYHSLPCTRSNLCMAGCARAVCRTRPFSLIQTVSPARSHHALPRINVKGNAKGNAKCNSHSAHSIHFACVHSRFRTPC